MTREEAVTRQSIGTIFGHQADSVSLLKLDEGAAAGCDVSTLLGGERVQNPVPIMQQIDAGCFLVDCAVELKLIHPWVLAGEVASLSVVVALPIVDDIFEGDGANSFREVTAETYGEGSFVFRARGAGRAWGPLFSWWSYVQKPINTLMLMNIALTKC